MNENNFYTRKKYKELLIWINSIESTYFSKTINNINDLKDGNVFIDLLKYYFKKNKNRYYYSLLNSLLTSNNSFEKMKIIFQIMLEMTNNNEIISRIKFFQNDINIFLENDDLIMELALYLNHLYSKHIYNKEIDSSKKKNKYFSYDENSNSKRSLKDFYDYNKYKRVIVNNIFNQNEDKKINFKDLKGLDFDNFSHKNLNVADINNLDFKLKNNDKKPLYNNKGQNKFIYRPRNTVTNIKQKFNRFRDNMIPPQINNINNNNNLINSQKLFNINQKENKKNILYTEQDNKRIALLNELDNINIINSPNKYINKNNNYLKENSKKNFDLENGLNEKSFKQENNSKNYSKNNINNIFGIFNNDISNNQEDEKISIYKILKLTNPIIDINNVSKMNPKLIIHKEQNNINKDSLKRYNKGNNARNKNKKNKNKTANTTLENERVDFSTRPKKEKNNENICQKKKEVDSPIKNLINNIDPFEKKMKRENSYLLGKNKKNKNNLNNNIDNKRSLSYLNLSNKDNKNDAVIISNTYNINNNLNIENKNINEIDKKEIYNWLLYLNIIKNEKVNLILLPELVSNGVILCDIINIYENQSNRIDGIIRKISSEEEALININKALDYLKKLSKFPKRHVSDNELIFEIDDKVIWELLYDLYNYYTKEEDRKKFREEKIQNQNKRNSLKNNENNSLYLKNEKYSYHITDLNNLNNNKDFNINNKNKHNNYEKNFTNYEDNHNTQPLYEPNLLTKSYNYYSNKYINNSSNHKNNMIKTHTPLDKSRNFSDSLENSKLIKKGYFDYVNELKTHFDKAKNSRKQINRGDIYEKESNILNYSKNNQQPVNFKANLNFNYDNDSIRYNNRNFREYSINSDYNYTDYYENNKKNNLVNYN